MPLKFFKYIPILKNSNYINIKNISSDNELNLLLSIIIRKERYSLFENYKLKKMLSQIAEL